MRRASLRIAPVLLPLLALLLPALAGLDFGRHWDERVHHARVLRFLETGVPKAPYYYYPGLCHRVLLWALAPEFASGFLRGEPPAATLQTLQELMSSVPYQLRSRRLFLAVSSLAVVWIYAAVLVSGGGVVQALLAASLLATSWEVGYHLRWVAPDGINMMLAAMTLALLAGSEASGGRLRGFPGVVAAAIPAGLAAGCKSQVGLLLLPVAVQVLRLANTWRRRIAWGAAVAAVFGLALLLASPEIVYDREKMLADIRKQGSTYANVGRLERGKALWCYRVEPGPRHLLRNVEYLGLVQSSPFVAGSVLVAALAAAGIAATVRRSRGFALVVLAFPVAYLAFQSMLRLHLVRNLLVLAPFGAFLAASGARLLWERSGRAGRGVLSVLAGALLVANVGWSVWAAGTIRSRGTDRFVRELHEQVASRQNVRFLASERVQRALEAAALAPPANLTTDPRGAVDVVAFFHREGLEANEWPARRGLLSWIGPHEINFCYYPSWSGDDRIVVMPIADARELGIRVLGRHP